VLAKILDLNSIKSNNTNLFTVISVTKCENSLNEANSKLCPSFDDFNSTVSKNEYSVYLIKLDPLSFGASNILFFHEEEKNRIDHLVIVTEPRRWIDKHFDFSIIIFQIIISAITGCLLDLEILKQLITM